MAARTAAPAKRRRAAPRKAAAAPRRRRRDQGMSMVKKAAKGGLIGIAASIGMTIVGQRLGQPLLAEAGQRGGAILASKFGGTAGQAAYQVLDAAFDRVVSVPGYGTVSGTRGYSV